MAFKMNANAKNYLITQGLITQMAGTSGTAGTASLGIYTGTQPANADAGTSGTLLCTISNIGWNAASGGSAGLAGTFNGTAAVAGNAGWGRMKTENANGTFCLDGDVSTSGTSTFQISNVAVEVDDILKLQSANLSIP
jgi:hypothetical protein